MHLEGSPTALIHEPERIKVTNEFKVTNQVYMQLTEPVIFEGLKHALKDLSGDATEFFSRAKKSAAEKKQPVGRVTNPMSEQLIEKIRTVIEPLMMVEKFKEHFVLAPCFNAEFLAENNAKLILDPHFWATGPHHESTN